MKEHNVIKLVHISIINTNSSWNHLGNPGSSYTGITCFFFFLNILKYYPHKIYISPPHYPAPSTCPQVNYCPYFNYMEWFCLCLFWLAAFAQYYVLRFTYVFAVLYSQKNITNFFFIHSIVDGYLIYFQYLAVINSLLGISLYIFFSEHMYAVLWIFTKEYVCWFTGYTYVYLQQILLNSLLKWLDQLYSH